MRSMSAKAKKVLVCYSGSETARRALSAAVEHVGYGSVLAVATVGGTGEPTANVVLSEARDVLLHKHVTATYVALVGDAADELLETASALDADLLVIGARTRNGHASASLGPVSSEVVQRAPCDVLVVR
jgi:nucleotide-binding universal stress UspA family protein